MPINNHKWIKPWWVRLKTATPSIYELMGPWCSRILFWHERNVVSYPILSMVLRSLPTKLGHFLSSFGKMEGFIFHSTFQSRLWRDPRSTYHSSWPFGEMQHLGMFQWAQRSAVWGSAVSCGWPPAAGHPPTTWPEGRFSVKEQKCMHIDVQMRTCTHKYV